MIFLEKILLKKMPHIWNLYNQIYKNLRPNLRQDEQKWYCKVKDFMKMQKKSAAKGVPRPSAKEENKKKVKKSATTPAIPAEASAAFEQTTAQDVIKMLKVR